MDSTKRVLKSLNWKRLLRKSSEDEYDSDETYCEDVANEAQPESPEIILHNKLGSKIADNSHENVISDQSATDLKILDSEMLYRSIFVEPESYQNKDGTKYPRLSYNDTINDDCDNVDCGIDKNEIESTRETTQDDIEQNVHDEFSLSLENYDLSLNEEEYSLIDTELDSFIVRGISLQEEQEEPSVPPLTLNRQSHQRRIPPAEKLLPWVRKRKRKIYSEKKKLPDRKCASFYIEKSNRMLEEQADCSSNSDAIQTLRDNSGHKKDRIHEFDKRKLESSKKYFGRKRGRPYKSTNGPTTEQNMGYKGHRSSYTSNHLKVLHDLEVDLNQLKRRLSRSVETRVEAFQMLSHVQTITKTLRFHLDRATRCDKSKEQNNKRKFLLPYLAQQISKSEELEKFLDNAIAESDRMTLTDATSLDNESIYSATKPHLKQGMDQDRIHLFHISEIKDTKNYNICGEKSNIKTALRNSKISNESAKSSSEARHISFSDEVECRYISCSTQSSNSGETDQQNGNNVDQNHLRIDEFEGNDPRYGAVSTKLFAQHVFSGSEAEEQCIFKSEASVARAKCQIYLSETPLNQVFDNHQGNKNLQLLKNQVMSIELGENTNSFGTKQKQEIIVLNQELIEQHLCRRSNVEEERRYNLEREDKINRANAALQILNEDGHRQSNPTNSKNEKSVSKLTSDQNTNPEGIDIGSYLPSNVNSPTVSNSIQKSSESSELFQSENSEISSIQLRTDYKVASDIILETKNNNSASLELFRSENSATIVNSPSIQVNDEFTFRDEESAAETFRKSKEDSKQLQLQLENSENQTEADGAFGFSELQSSIPQGETNWTPYTIKDIIAVRIKDPSEFVDLDDLPEGAMDPENWFDFDWKD